MSFLRRKHVPKAELHCHLEGAASPSFIAAIARRKGQPVDGFIDANGGYIWSDFQSFVTAYNAVSSLLGEPEDLAALAYDYASSLARADGIYLEVFASPAHAEESGLSFTTYVDAIAQGLERAEAEFGIVGRIIMVAVRHLGADKALAVARATVKADHPMVSGFGMAGDELYGDVKDFAPAFDVAREAGLGITVHAGELEGPQSIRQALDWIKPSRVGHGVRAIEDPELIRRLVDERIVLEVCPGSNVALGLYKNRALHPFKALFEAGLRVTLNSDDPPFFKTSLSAEYEQAQKVDRLTAKQLKAITAHAIEAAFIDAPTRIRLLAMAQNKRATPILPSPNEPRAF